MAGSCRREVQTGKSIYLSLSEKHTRHGSRTAFKVRKSEPNKKTPGNHRVTSREPPTTNYFNSWVGQDNLDDQLFPEMSYQKKQKRCFLWSYELMTLSCQVTGTKWIHAGLAPRYQWLPWNTCPTQGLSRWSALSQGVWKRGKLALPRLFQQTIVLYWMLPLRSFSASIPSCWGIVWVVLHPVCTFGSGSCPTSSTWRETMPQCSGRWLGGWSWWFQQRWFQWFWSHWAHSTPRIQWHFVFPGPLQWSITWKEVLWCQWKSSHHCGQSVGHSLFHYSTLPL